MEAKKLTPLQIDFLKLFSRNNSDEFVKEIRNVINEYLQGKIDDEIDRLFAEGELSMEKIQSWTNEELHKELRKSRNNG